MNITAYYITKPDGSQEGPYNRQNLISRIHAGKYPQGTQLWHKGLPGWEPLENHFNIRPTQTPRSVTGGAPQSPRATRPQRKVVGKSKQFPPPPHREPSPHKRPTSVIIATLLLLAAGGAVYWCSGGDEEHPSTVKITQKSPQLPVPPPAQTPPPSEPEPTPEPEQETEILTDIEPTEEIEEIKEQADKKTPSNKESMGHSLLAFTRAISSSWQAAGHAESKPPHKPASLSQKATAPARKTSATPSKEVEESELEAASTLTPEQTRKLQSCERKIRLAYKRKQNAYKRIAFYKQKIRLHDDCRPCHNCSSQGITGACRHWAMAEFDGKRIRVCHQLPQGSQRYSGIDQAISSLEIKIEVMQKIINGADEMINEQQQKMNDIAGDTVTPPEEPEYEYEKFIPDRGTSGSGRPNSRRGHSNSNYYSY